MGIKIHTESLKILWIGKLWKSEKCLDSMVMTNFNISIVQCFKASYILSWCSKICPWCGHPQFAFSFICVPKFWIHSCCSIDLQIIIYILRNACFYEKFSSMYTWAIKHSTTIKKKKLLCNLHMVKCHVEASSGDWLQSNCD